MAPLTRKILIAFMRFFFKHLYTTLAWAYDFVAWASSMGQWRTWLSVAIQDLPQGDLIELGPGPGHLLLQLAEIGRNVIGVEVSPQMIRMAAGRLQKHDFPLRLVRAQAQRLPLPTDAFGSVVSSFPSEYIFDPLTLSEAHRVLRPGGSWIIVGVARITGRSLPDRFAAWLYRFTGQSGEPQTGWDDALRAVGFDARLERVQLPRAEVLRVVAAKPMDAQ
jgi:ubiquinone/menaquinone biosynthesis C-methylase UbiE